MVSLSDFEAKYEDLDKSLMKTPILANRKASSLDTGVGKGTNEVEAIESSGKKGKCEFEREEVDSNAFIIQHGKAPEEVQMLRRGSPEAYNNDESKESGERYSLRQRIVEQVAVIFPSAFEHISGNIERYPYVMVRPTYFDRVSDEEQFLALARSQANFLSFETTDTKKDPLLWLRRLSGDTKLNRLVPLYALLLARFEWAVWESFLEFEHSRSGTQQDQLTDGTDAVEMTMAVVTNKSDYPRKHLLSILGDVLSYCGALNDLSMTIDSDTLAGFMAPFAEACLPTNHSSAWPYAHQVENVILTPLSWLLFSSGHGGPIDLGLLDKAVDASLRRMQDHGPGATQVKFDSEDPTMVRWRPSKAPLTVSVTDLNDNHKQSFQRKKKKKSKKKKVSRRLAFSCELVEIELTSAFFLQNKKVHCAQSKPVVSEPEQPLITSLTNENNVAKREIVVASVTETLVDHELQLEKGGDVSVESNSLEDFLFAEVREVRSIDSDDTVEDTYVPPSSEANSKPSSDMAISRHDGQILVAPPMHSDTAADETEASEDKDSTSENRDVKYGDGDCWETVEVRGRGSRKKPLERPPHCNSRQSLHSAGTTGSHDSHGGNSKKSKGLRTVQSRKKAMARKIVRDILFSVVDSIEEESRRRKQTVPSSQRAVNSWKNGPPGARQQGPALRRDLAAVVADAARSETSMRDVVMGKRPTPATSTTVPSKENFAERLLLTEETTKFLESLDELDDAAERISPGTKRAKSQIGVGADQNTAPTYQETVSASSNARANSREEPQNTEYRKSDSSTVDTEEAPQIRDREAPSKSDANVVSTPPLPTLLSPENANSATSSVASSLEAPHAGRLHHHSVAAADVNDVGYHLLDVCDRLSRDMSLFMSRRALALSARRRERGALVAALQDSVSSIWPGRCHVELYGSCATQLDLPASDIDVVVIGLDKSAANMSPPILDDGRSKSAKSSDRIGASVSTDETLKDDAQQRSMQQYLSAFNFGMMPVHRNAERVVRLATDLEGQPWAVQVNAIPTASVPVLKILADPSKLPSNGGEWMAQQHHMAAQAAAAAGTSQSQESRSNQEYPNAEHGFYPHPTLLPWRGSDVMKGLLSLDITFEGPEHGGVGSTEFSSQTVAEECAKSGLDPDATPFVQVLMVLKELLAQRKLNEPYSGGLSSYALLLLVLALVRERAVIKEEIELVEQQKRAMAAGELNSFGTGPIVAFPSGVYPTATSSLKPNQFEPAEPTANTSKKLMAITKGEPPASQKKQGTPKQEVPNVKVEAKDARQHLKKNTKKSQAQAKNKLHPHVKSSSTPSNPPSSSWANIAKKSSEPKSSCTANTNKQNTDVAPAPNATAKWPQKPSFADAVVKYTHVAGDVTTPVTSPERMMAPSKNQNCGVAKEPSRETWSSASEAVYYDNAAKASRAPPKAPTEASDSVSPTKPAKASPAISSLGNSMLRVAPPFYPQGYNDIVEVLCSGETTAGKLLMHFLLFYGQHFDAQSTAIDISGKHERGFTGQAPPYSYLSPYIQRQALGNIDPITGMLTVDPIVIYDPLEGVENNNVARRCFAWNSVRWIFAQSYATLASAVERSASPPATPGGSPMPSSPTRDGRNRESEMTTFNPDAIGDLLDPSSPLLKCLLSF